MVNTSGSIDYEKVIADFHAKIDYLECKNKELTHRLKMHEEKREDAKSSLKSWWICIAFFLVISVAWFGGEILFYGCSQSSLIDTFIAAVISRHLTNIWMKAV